MRAKRFFVTACALTGLTEVVVRRSGARVLLPDVFVPRFAALAGIAPAHFAEQLRAARTFTDQGWTAHWGRIAEQHRAAAEELLCELAEASPGAEIGALLAPAGTYLAERGSAEYRGIEHFVRGRTAGRALDEQTVTAVRAVEAIVKSIVYQLIAAWPGTSAHRMRAYALSQRLFRELLTGSAGALDISVEVADIPVGGETARLWTVLPNGIERCAMLLATNGLDGTAQELLLGLLTHVRTGLGVAVLEMPGSYAYRHPMSVRSERIYAAVIDRIVAHPRVDPARFGMLGLSLGGYWSARMAAVDPRLRFAIACGAPLHRSFGPAAALGAPAILVRTMRNLLGAHGLADLGRKLRALPMRALAERISVPLLVINGAQDTVVDPRDSVDLAATAPAGMLWLYPDDDHCAIGNFPRWLDEAVAWLHGVTDTGTP